MNSARRPEPRRSELLQMVAFTIGDGEFAIDIMRIKEIINPLPITRVPKAPPFIEGVLELRGAILPVVDLRKRFDMPASPLTRASKFLIVALENPALRTEAKAARRMLVGLVVDGAREPIRVDESELRPTPALTQGEAAYFRGVLHHQDRIVMLLDIDAILSTQEKISLAGLTASDGARR